MKSRCFLGARRDFARFFAQAFAMRLDPDTLPVPSLANTSRGQLTTALLALATVLLPLGLTLPALETSQFAFWRTEHSILSFGWALIENRAYWLALVVFGFSIVFPGIKLIWMWRLQFQPGLEPNKVRLRWLETLGKWSMGDVLVIALIVFSFKGSLVLGARALPGVWIFAGATVLGMIASGRIVKQFDDRRT
jgi:paraquat-inducible protein A